MVGAYPFEFVATRVAGDHATVTNLLAPGSDGHDLELSPQQVDEIQKSAEAKGKQDWTMDLEVKDADGNVCCTVRGTWQLRRF